jgi:Phage integrase, N-terminal SAM-like domain
VSVFDSVPGTAAVVRADQPVLDEAELAAVAFLARYSGRTLESYRSDLRQYLAWMTLAGVPPLLATRTHLELYRAWMEERGLAASTVDRRLSTVCGYYRFAHLDGRITGNPAQHVRHPRVHPSTQRGLDRGELATFLYSAERVSPTHAALAVLLGLNGLRDSEACGANVEEPRHRARTSHPAHRRQGQPARHRPARPAHRPHHRPRRRGTHNGTDPDPPRRVPTRPAHRPPLGPIHRSTGGTGSRSSAHAARGVHHGRLGRRRAVTRRAAGGPPRRPSDHHHLRPAPAESRPARRLRRRRLCYQRLTGPTRSTEHRVGDSAPGAAPTEGADRQFGRDAGGDRSRARSAPAERGTMPNRAPARCRGRHRRARPSKLCEAAL